MKKILQSIFSYTKRTVRDVNTGKLETATYTKVFGIVVKTHYEAITEDELIEYLGILR